MATYLIVANRTLASPTLAEAIEERLGRGPASFHVVVPATPVAGGLTWDEDASRAAAEQRLEAIVQHLCDLGATDATGEIGVPDPVAAANDALYGRDIDEVILSTLPAGISRWLGQDVPSKMRGAVPVPVTVVTAKEAVTSG
jgi:hypothetical protein